MREYLMSPVGGGWRDDEIEVINQKLLKNIKFKLSFHNEDFCLVYFSGHGDEAVQGIPTICLNDFEMDVPVKALCPFSKCGIVITDCCRGNGQDDVVNESRKIASTENFELLNSDDVSRDLWERALKKSIEENNLNGIVMMSSCSYNETAGETKPPDAHGLYTYALLKEARKWHLTATKNHYLTTLQIHNRIYEYMVRQAQHPCYTPENLEYPFAVKA